MKRLCAKKLSLMTNFEKLRGHKLSRINIFEDTEKKKINFYVTVLL